MTKEQVHILMVVIDAGIKAAGANIFQQGIANQLDDAIKALLSTVTEEVQDDDVSSND